MAKLGMNKPIYIHISNDAPLPDIQEYKPFKAVVIIEELVAGYYELRVSRWLVDQGCLCMHAWGLKCTEWDDSVDHANLEKFYYKDIPDEARVMTTWHENQTLKEVFRFAKFDMLDQNIEERNDRGQLISKSEVPYKNMILLPINPIDRQKEILELYNKPKCHGTLGFRL